MRRRGRWVAYTKSADGVTTVLAQMGLNDAVLEYEARAVLGEAKANAGVQFRTKRIPNHHEVSGYQADIVGGANDKFSGILYDETALDGAWELVKAWSAGQREQLRADLLDVRRHGQGAGAAGLLRGRARLSHLPRQRRGDRGPVQRLPG